MERFGAVFARNCRCHAIMRDATMIAFAPQPDIELTHRVSLTSVPAAYKTQHTIRQETD